MHNPTPIFWIDRAFTWEWISAERFGAARSDLLRRCMISQRLIMRSSFSTLLRIEHSL